MKKYLTIGILVIVSIMIQGCTSKNYVKKLDPNSIKDEGALFIANQSFECGNSNHKYIINKNDILMAYSLPEDLTISNYSTIDTYKANKNILFLRIDENVRWDPGFLIFKNGFFAFDTDKTQLGLIDPPTLGMNNDFVFWVNCNYIGDTPFEPFKKH